ncbi:MAG: transposase [Acidobacteriota bacterium]|nr:MAG: transposase [Acidobacteriota bacterium]
MPTYPDWEENKLPYGFLITFRTYGTWLHGDERGSVDRNNNIYASPKLPRNDGLKAYRKRLLRMPPVKLDAAQRSAVNLAVREVCDHRNWTLRVLNVRTNHVHVVVSTSDRDHSKVLNAFKAYATRKLRAEGLWQEKASPWADRGSQRVLWNANSLENACHYVKYCQGPDLNDFDLWLKRNGKARRTR